MKIIFCFFIVPWLLGCQTRGVRVEGVEYSLSAIDVAIQASLPRGLNTRSSNGRTYTSKPYDPKGIGHIYFEDKLKERAVAVFIVLGAARPYEIEVAAYVERRDPRDKGEWRRYETVGIDYKETDRLIVEFQKNLAKRKERPNIIDDFRAF